ncbi:hypothetical protein, partial [Stenotrophomonas sp. CASM112]|uniref:hypothetical protein n=1 Tax=Stenotrophomonas sp. CASM112 TaxID=3111511 RepID=UPI003BF8997A
MALSKTRQSPSMVLDGAIHGANGFGVGHPPPLDSFRVARTGRAESKAEAKAKRQPLAAFFRGLGSDPFAHQRDLTPAFDPAFAHPSAAGRLEGPGWQGCPG